jgi:hypothetical protein
MNLARTVRPVNEDAAISAISSLELGGTPRKGRAFREPRPWATEPGPAAPAAAQAPP